MRTGTYVGFAIFVTVLIWHVYSKSDEPTVDPLFEPPKDLSHISTSLNKPTLVLINFNILEENRNSDLFKFLDEINESQSFLQKEQLRRAVDKFANKIDNNEDISSRPNQLILLELDADNVVIEPIGSTLPTTGTKQKFGTDFRDSRNIRTPREFDTIDANKNVNYIVDFLSNPTNPKTYDQNLKIEDQFDSDFSFLQKVDHEKPPVTYISPNEIERSQLARLQKMQNHRLVDEFGRQLTLDYDRHVVTKGHHGSKPPQWFNHFVIG